MLRLTLRLAAVFAFLLGTTALAQNQNPNAKDNKAEKAVKDTDNKDLKKDKGERATITDVDAKKGTITVRMKDKDGKEQTRTFRLTEDVRMFDSTGRVAAIDVFRSGDEILVVEQEGKLREVRQNKGKKAPEKEIK
jgi:hypothetical protein